MEQYIVSARKYRPDTFESLIGQDNIARTLKNSITRGQLAHAYLFCGPRGVGKTTTARIFAKTINCMNPSEGMDPCGECESCKAFDEGRSYCIHELDAASNNGVDDMKALVDQVRIPPAIGKYSVYIIDEVHMLTTAAFNAFLKTLEEPPAHAIFILATTEKHKILPTIMSRCQTYDFNRISVENIVKNLRDIAAKEGVAIDDESMHVIAAKADGAMRDALTIFDQTVAFCGKNVQYKEVLKNLNVLDYEYTFSLTESFLRGDYASTLLIFDEILGKGFNALHFVSALSSHFRNLAVSRNNALDSLLELPESIKTRYREQSSRCQMRFIYDALKTLSECESGYRASVNQRLHIEFALMQLCVLGAKEVVLGVPAQQVVQQAQAQQPVQAAQIQQAPSQPAAPQQAEPQEQPRRRSAARNSGVSFKALSEKLSEQPQPLQQDQVPTARLVEPVMKAKWGELATIYGSMPRLANAISAAEPRLSEVDGVQYVTFMVQNEAQKKWIEAKLLHDLEGNFQRITSTGAKMKIEVIPVEEETNVAYTPTDKVAAVMAKNGEVALLAKDLNLELK